MFPNCINEDQPEDNQTSSETNVSKTCSSDEVSSSSVGSKTPTNKALKRPASCDVDSLVAESLKFTPTQVSRVGRKYSQPKKSQLNRSLNEIRSLSPDNSLTESGYSSKRRRWSDVTNFKCYSPYINRLNRSHITPETIVPELLGYQMVGDSQFCRFGEQILGLQREFMPYSSGRIGICISGQKISDLHKKVKEKFYPISPKVILMIGTNDFLKKDSVEKMCQELSALISTLQQVATSIVLLTLPPIPKLAAEDSIDHFNKLDAYNNYIRSLEDGERIRIADICSLYIRTSPVKECQMQLFERYFGNSGRLDLIHLNRQGLEIIHKYILQHF